MIFGMGARPAVKSTGEWLQHPKHRADANPKITRDAMNAGAVFPSVPDCSHLLETHRPHRVLGGLDQTRYFFRFQKKQQSSRTSFAGRK
jgi:hypothetical protein